MYAKLLAVILCSFLFFSAKSQVSSLTEGFDTGVPATWTINDNSDPSEPQVPAWFQGSGEDFVAHSGSDSSYVASSYLSIIDPPGVGTISNWLITPVLNLQDGAEVKFWTRTFEQSDFPDRLEVRLSQNDTSTDVGTTATDVGDFTNLLVSVNSTLAVGGYPEEWTEFTVTLSGITGATGRIAFRYFVTEGGPVGDNSNGVGVDDFSYAVTLPVTFMNFNGTVKDNTVLLSWATSNELNNKGYDVERSINGKDFSAIGFVEGNGSTTNVNNYTYNDIGKLPAGSLYYRLKQIDLDGTYEYSSIIKVDIDNEFSFNVYPNPVANNNSWAQFQLSETAQVSMQLVSSEGKILQSVNKGLLSSGTYSIPLSLNNAVKGTYFVKLNVGDKTYTQKVIK